MLKNVICHLKFQSTVALFNKASFSWQASGSLILAMGANHKDSVFSNFVSLIPIKFCAHLTVSNDAIMLLKVGEPNKMRLLFFTMASPKNWVIDIVVVFSIHFIVKKLKKMAYI